ncbi:MAG: MFS transporter [Alphaproteobacteria bacterium]|nr:MFS transporter [Alphaproteobacteria bacterium]
MTDIAATGRPRATQREWIGLAVLALPCLLYSMDLTVLMLAMPHLTADLAPTAPQLLWIVDIYGFVLAGSLITMGTLGDRIGRRKLLLIGATAFGVASVFAAFADTAAMLIVARAVLGVAAATLAPSTLSLLRNMFLDPRQRTFAIGVWIASFSAGAAIGPLTGGALLAEFWWGSVFLINVPVMLLLLAVGPFLLPEFRDQNPGRLDIASAALSLAAVLAVIYGMKCLAAEGPGWIPALAIVAGIALGLGFVRRQRRLADPLIDVRLFRNPAFATSVAANLLGVFIAFGTFLLVTQYLQLVLGMGPFEAGLWTAPSGVIFVFGSLMPSLLLRVMRPAQAIAAGFAVAAVGMAILSQFAGSDGPWVLVAGFLLFCLGLAPVATLTTDTIIGIAPPERAGAAAAISETGAEFGGALGIAVLGSVVTAVYGGAVTEAVAISAPGAVAARESLAGAVAVAAEIGGDAGGTLLVAGRAAFAQALAVTSTACAVIAFGTALLVAVVLRRVPAGH